MTLLIGLAIRSSVVLAVGLLLSACLAKRSAALRHRVLAAALLSAALVLPLNLALPEWNVTWPARIPAFINAASSSVTPPLPHAVSLDALTSVAVAPQPSTPEAVSPIVVAWLAGVLVAASTLVAGLVRVGRVAARASRVEDRRWLQVLDTVAHRYGLTRRIAISRTASTDLLATWGGLRPQVLLPHHSHDWTLDRVHAVLCHELAHIRRHDWLVQIGAETLRALLWFNPLVWMVCTRLRRESEQACDDEVLGVGVGGREYATHLFELARQCRRPVSTWASATPMAHPSTLERRIVAMLNPRLDRQAPSRRAMATLAIVLLLVTLPVAALRARQAGPAPLSGTIYDVTGAVLPGVEVALVDANQITQVVTSNASGRFEFAAVLPGKYVLQATLAGFRALRHEFELRNARDWDRVVTLQVGDVKEEIFGPQLDVANFCCPEYLETMIRRIRSNWDERQGASGQALVKFTIRRDGTLTNVEIAKTSANALLDLESRRAVIATRQVPALPDQFSRPDLTVYLTFAYTQ